MQKNARRKAFEIDPNWLRMQYLLADRTPTDIAAEVGCSYSTVLSHLKRLGILRPRLKHGHTAGYRISPEYNAWQGAIARCSNQNHPHWEHYGGRGITVCERWSEPGRGSSNFLADMGERPAWANGGLDRINNDGGYWCGHCVECQANSWPANCRWTTKKEQALNRRRGLRRRHKASAAD